MPAKRNNQKVGNRNDGLPVKSKPVFSKKRISSELLHDRLGHRFVKTIMAASEHGVWADVVAELTRDADCVDCKIATIRASDRCKHVHTASDRFGEMVFLDIQQAKAGGGLTPDSSLPYYLFVVDAYARYCKLYGLRDKSTEEVISAIKKFIAHHGLITQFGYIDVERLRADAGSQFTSKRFKLCV